MVFVKPHKRGESDVKGHTRSPPKRRSSPAAAAAAITVALSGIAGGTSVAEGGTASLGDYSNARPSQGQDAGELNLDMNGTRGRIQMRIKGSDDEIKARLRLRQLGQHPTSFESESTTDCALYSSGKIRTFLTNHHCISLNRTFVEVGEKAYAIQFFIATIQMPDDRTASDLHALFLRDGTGNMTPLFPKSGKYRHIPVTDAPPSKTTLHDDTVINIQGQGLGRTPGAALTSSLATSVLFNLDTM